MLHFLAIWAVNRSFICRWYHHSRVQQSIEQSLNDFGTDYIDLVRMGVVSTLLTNY